MSDFLEQQHPSGEPHLLQQQPGGDRPLKRENDSTDDFEHLEHEQHPQPAGQQPLLDLSSSPQPPEPHNLQDGLPARSDLLDTSVPASNSVECDLKPVPATPPPSADFEKFEAEGGARRPAEATSFATGQRKDELEARIREQLQDAKAATMAFMESEKSSPVNLPKPFEVSALEQEQLHGFPDSKEQLDDDDDDDDLLINSTDSQLESGSLKKPGNLLLDAADNNEDDNDDDMEEFGASKESQRKPPSDLYGYDGGDFVQEIKSSTLPEPEKSPELDFVKDEIIVHEATKEKPGKTGDELWNVLEKSGNDKFEEKEMLRDEPPTKPLPPLPKGAEQDMFDDYAKESNKYEMSNDFLLAESKSKAQLSGGETGDSEFESEPEPSPAKTAPAKPAPVRPELGDAAERKVFYQKPDKVQELVITPRALFRQIGIDAWFNPERLNPKVASLIYWRDPKKSGIVFGAILGVLLSLAYFSLISVVAYISLLTLTATVAFRIYKTVQQAIQKTSDGHPFKDLLELDLTLPTEKVHEVADIAVANANAAVSELRRLFLVEDIVDSLKFGILLWSLTYLGAWFNGMTLIIIGVVALFTLPKVYETNKTQIDQNLGMVQARINDLTAKIKAALPIGKKAEPTKEE